jgi:hypothetical protein
MVELELFYVYTPLGLSEVYGAWPNGDDPEWVTFVVSTGECWTWKNEFIRRAPTVSNQRHGLSGFGDLNEETLRHIARYKRDGFLPATYSPRDPKTWQ